MTSDEDAHDGATILVEPAHRRAVITWAPGVPVFNPWMATMERLLSHPSSSQSLPSSPIGAPRPAHRIRHSSIPSWCFVNRSVAPRRLTGRWATVIAASTTNQSGPGRIAELQASESGSETRIFYQRR
jgi:hypothetical protein